jgi:peptide-methionine (S)-S-oxide reductase
VLNPDQPYIAINDIPKVEALQRLFPAEYSAQPRTVLGGRSPS